MSIPSISFVAAMAVVGCAISLPGSAQTAPLYDFALEVTPPEALVPVGAATERSVSLTVWCLSPGAAALSPFPFEATVDTGHPDVQATVAPAAVNVPIDPATCASGERVNVTLGVTVQLGMGVVAGHDVPVNLTVRSNEQVRAVAWDEASEPVLATTVAFDEKRFKTGPNSRIILPVRVVNEGNSAVTVSFSPAPGTSPELNFALPGPFVVPLDPGMAAVPVDVQTPFENGYMEQVDELALNAHVSWTDDPAFKETLEPINATIETVGTYLPGPGAVLVAALVVGALAAARRRAA